MRSFAIWYNSEKKDMDKKLEVHINLLRENRKQKKTFCFDFGFFISDLEGINAINLFLPFDDKNIEYFDLGEKLTKKNEKVINAIFNENYSVKFGHRAKSNLVETNPHKKEGYNGRVDFFHYSLDKNVQIQKNSQGEGGGTILQIITKDISIEKIKAYYFRIRVKVTDNLNIINDRIGENSFLQEAFTNIEVIDFRLNDVRSCGENIKEKFENEPNFNIEKVHYLILRNAKDEVIYYGGEINSRILEKDLWEDYFDSEYLKEDLIAYHLKKKCCKTGESVEYIKDFSSLIRFRYKKISFKSLGVYFIVFSVLSLIAALIGSIIK